MADIPLAQDDKGAVLGWDGKQWRPPDEAAEDKGGRRAYRFGESWQIAPERAAPLSGPPVAAPKSESSLLDKSRVVGTAALQGATDAIRFPSVINEAGGDAVNWAMRKLGLISMNREQQRERLRKGGITPTYDRLPSVTKTVESVGIPTDWQAEGKRLGVDTTGTLGDIASGTRAASGAYLTGAGPLFSGLSGVGQATLGDAGAIGLPIAFALGRGAVRAGVGAAKNVTAPFTNKGLQGMADKAILEASGTTPQALAQSMRPAPLQGQPASLGQLTGNRGLLDAEYTLHSKTPLIEDAFRKTSQRAGQEMDAIALGASERAASEALRKSLTDTYRAAKTPVSAEIEAAKNVIGQHSIPGPLLESYVSKHLSTLSGAKQSAIPVQTQALLKEQFKKQWVPLNEVDDVMSLLKSAAREMPASDARRVVMERFAGHMQELPKNLPGVSKAYANYAKFKGDFDQNKLIGKLFARNTDRTFKIPASEVGETLLKMPAEAIERAAKLSPGVQQAMRDWVAAAWRDRSFSANTATRTAQAPNLAGALKFRQDYDHIFKAAFSKQDLQKTDAIIDALKMPGTVEFGQRTFGSPSYNKFVKGTLFEGVAGRILGNIPGGGMVNQALGNFVFSKPIAELELKIAEALLNPQSTMARLLTMKATPGNAKLLNHYMKTSPAVAAPMLSREE